MQQATAAPTVHFGTTYLNWEVSQHASMRPKSRSGLIPDSFPKSIEFFSILLLLLLLLLLLFLLLFILLPRLFPFSLLLVASQ